MQQVKVKISKDGEIKYETTGYVGGACKEVQVAMVRVGGITNEKLTGEACATNDMPAYNEIGMSQQQG